MNRPSTSYITEITAVADQWLRRCNGHPRAGIPISRRGLAIVLGGSDNVTADAQGVISWTAEAGEFTAVPVRTGT